MGRVPSRPYFAIGVYHCAPEPFHLIRGTIWIRRWGGLVVLETLPQVKSPDGCTGEVGGCVLPLLAEGPSESKAEVGGVQAK